MGNQMFEYAYARALALEYGEKLIVNPYFMTLAGFGAGRKNYYNNVLEKLNIPEEVSFMNRSQGYMKGIPDIAEFVLLRKYKNGQLLHGEKTFHKMNERGKLYTDDCFTYYQCRKAKKRTKKIIGYYQSEKYFEKYKDIICSELRVMEEPSGQNRQMIEEIVSCNAVCVHIRRGDYVSNSKNAALVVCDEAYYKQGMEYVKEHVSNPVFFVFSDNNEEIEWIKKNYQLEDFDVRYVTLNNPDYEELRLMYHCKHFVIANSTFSWWGAYLSDNKNKIVIAPTVWNKEYNKQVDVYLEDMIKI